MYNIEEVSAIETIYKTVHPLMSTHNIPMTPENYTLWYHYVCGNNKTLTAIINKLINEKKHLTKNALEKLYKQYCTEHNTQNIAKIRDELEILITSFFRQVGSMSGKTDLFYNTIDQKIEELSKADSLKGIETVVTEIASETKGLGNFVQDLQDELSDTHNELKQLRKSFEEIRSEALIDFLTSLPNRKAFEETLQKMATKNQPLALLIVDIDFFKKFNDTFGHLVGDEVLKFVAHKLRDMIRGTDFVARFGGEEFVILLPKTDIRGAQAVAGNLREFFYNTRLKGKGGNTNLGKITVSIGVALYQKDEKKASLIERADKALYFAKEHGRNRVATEHDL